MEYWGRGGSLLLHISPNSPVLGLQSRPRRNDRIKKREGEKKRKNARLGSTFAQTWKPPSW